MKAVKTSVSTRLDELATAAETWRGRLHVFAPLLALYILVSLAGSSLVQESDEGAYLFYAERLIEGKYAVRDAVYDYQYLYYPPGLPVVLAPFVALEAPLAVVRLVGPLCLYAAVVAFYGLARLYGSTSRVALMAALGLGLYLPFFVLLPRVWSEPLALLCVVAGLFFATRYVHGGRRWDLLPAAIALGWLALSRPAFGYVLAVLLALFAAGAIVRRQWGSSARWGVTMALALVVCTPWLAYTWHVTGEPFYWANSGSANLYWMASPSKGNHGDWRARNDPMATADREFLASLPRHDPFARDRIRRRRALQLIREHPQVYGEHVGANILRQLFDIPHSYGAGHGKAAVLYAVPNVVLLVLLVLSPLRLRRHGALAPPLAPAALFAGVVFGFQSLLAAEPRMLTAVVPIVLLVVARAFVPAVEQLRAQEE